MLEKINQMKITIEIPTFKRTSGGIMRHVMLAKMLKEKEGLDVHLRIQRNNTAINYSQHLKDINFSIGIPVSIGIPDRTFPESDVVITYSDTPHGEKLTALRQVKKVIVYMLSYGLCLERERKNVFNPKIAVMSSTLKLKRMIEADGGSCTYVGFGLNPNEFYIEPGIKRKSGWVAILYHPSPNKQYKMAVRVCDELYKIGKIKKVIVFGMRFDGVKSIKDTYITYLDASHDVIRKIFCLCVLFIMPSISEGLNMTPMEATLCGCPAVICDGAFGDLYFNNKTCVVAKKGDFQDILEKSINTLNNPNLGLYFKERMEKIIINYTWDNTIENIMALF